MPAYRELHYCHCIDRRKRYIHWLMVGVVAHQFDASFLFGPVGILHRQILVSVDHERNQVYFPVNNVLEAVYASVFYADSKAYMIIIFLKGIFWWLI